MPPESNNSGGLERDASHRLRQRNVGKRRVPLLGILALVAIAIVAGMLLASMRGYLDTPNIATKSIENHPNHPFPIPPLPQ